MESEVEIREATPQDALYVGKYMRKADRHEIWASHRHKAEHVVVACYLQKECLCVLIDGKPSILFGCADEKSYGVPWLLATDDINKIGVRFILGSRQYVEQWIKQYKYLMNYVHAENTVSIRWLKWLGFNMCEKVIVNGEYFIKFEMKEGEHV